VSEPVRLEDRTEGPDPSGGLVNCGSSEGAYSGYFRGGFSVMRKDVWLSEGSVGSMPCLKRKFREGERVK